MVEPSPLIKKLVLALNAKGVGGACPMCLHNEWMIEDDFPISRVHVATEESQSARPSDRYYPSYWLYCGNCGFVAQFVRSIVEGETKTIPEDSSDER